MAITSVDLLRAAGYVHIRANSYAGLCACGCGRALAAGEGRIVRRAAVMSETTATDCAGRPITSSLMQDQWMLLARTASCTAAFLADLRQPQGEMDDSDWTI